MKKIERLKVMTVVGTRPEIIRLSCVISKLDKYCDHLLVHTGQNYDYELNEIFFDDLKLRKPDYFLNSADESFSPANTIGNIISEVDKVLSEINPDALLVLGDTNSCLSVIPAKRRKIPIFHMEAGNRCFDMRVPEEINRRIVDHTSDINITYSSIAREYLLREGLPPEQVIKSGSPMYEVLHNNLHKIKNSDVLSRLKLKNKEYFLISAHREENIDSDINFQKLSEILNTLASKFEIPIIVSTHPRTQKRVSDSNLDFNPLVNFLKPLGFHDYVKLQMESKAVLSDSGTINEEASILNFRALNIRETHERPEGMEEGAVIMVGMNLDRIMQSLFILSDQAEGKERNLRIVSDYSMPNVSDKTIRIINSYNDYINRVFWKKY